MTEFAYAALLELLSLAVLGVLYSMYRLRREAAFHPWLATWGLMAVHYLAHWVELEVSGPWARAVDRWLFALALLALLYSARMQRGRKQSLPAYAVAGAALGVWCFWHAWQLTDLSVNPLWGAALVAVWAGMSFWRGRMWRESLALELLAGSSLLLAGLLAAPMLPWLPAEQLQDSYPIGLVLRAFSLLVMGISMVMLAYERVHQRVEDNMMSFSLLNLATSGLQSDHDIAAMFEKLVDRVLAVLRLERALMVVHNAGPAPLARIFQGFAPGFREEWTASGLDIWLSERVAHVGGMLVIPDLDDPAVLPVLNSGSASPQHADRLVALLRQARVPALLAISLRTQKRLYGTLVLAHPQQYPFSSAELRLLTSLGAQVGMGVENFLLMKQTARRNEELRLLTHTGRAISSSRESAALLRLIHEEMRKLMDCRNLYVAMLDEARDEIRFELEVEDGAYLPPRSRKRRGGLTEHVLRTGEALLIAERFEARLVELGIALSGRPAKCWAGVPIILRGQAAGVLAVQSYEQERAYDEEHIEILRIVAAQAAVALENARLFAEDQRRLRQITFLHDLTRTGISTLNADDMLSEMVREIQKHFGFDHAAIAVVDHQAKQVEIRAQAGPLGQVPGSRLALDAGLIGRTGRSGQPEIVNDLAADPGLAGVFPAARAAACVPIIYAEQTLGGLLLQSRQAGAFPPDLIPLLRTVADHVASALHNALTFQRTQEQAITDGLTGVKTHRYFMEALNAEWKRSTRAGRIFSLLVMDLDRFKQVNDTLGHLEGDLVLVRLGQILEQRCRQSNVVARYGGDEFFVLMPEATTEMATVLAERLRLWIATEPLFAERHLTSSFGVATFPVHGHTPEEIIRAADAGMYMSKRQGGNRVSVAEQFRQGLAERWRAHVFASFQETLGRHSEATGPDFLQRLIERMEEAWEAFPGARSELMRAVEDGLTALADLMDERVLGLRGHQEKVAVYAQLLATELNLPEVQKQHLRTAARLHDIGYLAVVPEVLDKKSKLSPNEYAEVHVHAGAGARLLHAARLDPEIVDMVRHHHEFVNGRGYPDGLPGERIPLGARILAVVDAFEAITSDRPYRPARSPAEAIEELERFAGTQFDELLVQAFARAMRAGGTTLLTADSPPPRSTRNPDDGTPAR